MRSINMAQELAFGGHSCGRLSLRRNKEMFREKKKKSLQWDNASGLHAAPIWTPRTTQKEQSAKAIFRKQSSLMQRRASWQHVSANDSHLDRRTEEVTLPEGPMRFLLTSDDQLRMTAWKVSQMGRPQGKPTQTGFSSQEETWLRLDCHPSSQVVSFSVYDSGPQRYATSLGVI